MKRTKTQVQTRARNIRVKSLTCAWSRKWSEEEIELLKKYYEKEGPSYLVKLLPNRTRSQIRDYAHNSLGLCCDNRKYKLTDDDLQFIKNNYGILKAKEMAKQLSIPESVLISIANGKLGLKYKNDPWSEEENKLLIKYYPIEGINCYKRFDGRTKNSVVNQAQNLNLVSHVRNKPYKCIETGETYTRIAECPYGYSIWNHLKGKTSYCGKLSDGTKLHWKYIEEEDNEEN